MKNKRSTFQNSKRKKNCRRNCSAHIKFLAKLLYAKNANTPPSPLYIDRCKEEKHPLKVVDAEKHFFECADSGNRTVSLHKIPKFTCHNCRSSRWERAAMIKDKKVDASADRERGEYVMPRTTNRW